MPNQLMKVTYAKKLGSDWDFANAVQLKNARIQSIIKGWGSIKDKATLILSKGKAYFDGANLGVSPDLSEYDMVTIYRAKNKALPYTWTTNDILFQGTVQTLPQEVNDQGNIVTIDCYNFAEVFFNVEIPYYAQQKTAPEMAREIIQKLQAFGTPIYWDTDNPTLMQDGITEFKKNNFAINYTPVFTILDRIFGQEFTGDGQYYWWINLKSDGKKYFSFRARDTTISGTIDETMAIQKVKIERGKDVITNFVIYNCGTDLYGNSVEDYAYDASSIGRYGWNTTFMIQETGDLFSSIIAQEWTAKKSSFTFDSNGNLSSPYPTAYPYTFYFDSTITVNSNSDFNQRLVVEALVQGKAKALAFIKSASKAQYIVAITMPWSDDFVIGALYQLNLSKIRNFPARMRIKQITYDYGSIEIAFDQDLRDRTL